MKVGYARVSTIDQNLDLQKDALQKLGCEKFYEEKASGKKMDRPELEHCLKSLRSGDTLCVWRLDRLGRSLQDLITIVTSLENAGIAFASVTENIDTSTATGKLMFHVFGALAEFERNLIRERTSAGLQAARARGRVGGRKKILDNKQLSLGKAMLADKNNKVGDVAKTLGISRATLYRHFDVAALSL
jgi:DNA invertase Pin-like site-specific DNA recombinase